MQTFRECPGGPVVRHQAFTTKCAGSIFGQRAKVLQTVRCSQNRQTNKCKHLYLNFYYYNFMQMCYCAQIPCINIYTMYINESEGRQKHNSSEPS